MQPRCNIILVAQVWDHIGILSLEKCCECDRQQGRSRSVSQLSIGIGNCELAIANWESGIGNRESGIGNRELFHLPPIRYVNSGCAGMIERTRQCRFPTIICRETALPCPDFLGTRGFFCHFWVQPKLI